MKILLNGSLYYRIDSPIKGGLHKVTNHGDSDGPYIVIRDQRNFQIFMGGSRLTSPEDMRGYKPF